MGARYSPPRLRESTRPAEVACPRKGVGGEWDVIIAAEGVAVDVLDRHLGVVFGGDLFAQTSGIVGNVFHSCLTNVSLDPVSYWLSILLS